ncbi:hypothetical protein EN858_14895 [Mesorhizobium sp. M4B.F.Ca.ET.215.01.1.1]|uniref:hypothetical protein n=1 Tax=unclassified Mesorhizobium TaxID=325217 RepID=UPI00109361B7|nr:MULTISPECIES: hypothetical protein [unclassified Mesorhizobium]TGQ11207.1 hypothetical protein EN858_14895 [Mesorhizobium sp. M4B.F.Ca.ET.215.01.1.1]TGR04740.1 hypothetical protein EN846_13185 [Mesorhizobium sp. M4B.F.Ca.ET.203.01.1.1]
MLVAYAGKLYDEEEQYAHPMQINAYDKFMAGWDTQRLAARYHVKERTALRWVNNERSRRHGLPSPYGERP